MRIPAGKTTIPDLPDGHVRRPRLLTALDRGSAAPVVVLSAPAGYGKTVLLTDWVAHGGPDTAWVSLDGDDDQRTLWWSVLTALTGLSAVPPDSPLHRVGEPGGPDEGDLVEQLLVALEQQDTPLRLVLDDVHELTAPAARRDLARFVRRRPRAIRLVLSGRADPPISLPRLRLEGHARELRADQLRFTLDEAGALLAAGGARLDPAQLGRLLDVTGGWVAGLRLAALGLARADDPDSFLAEFSGDDPAVAEYLDEEVLSAFDEPTQDFLRRAGVCSRLPAGLAVALTGRGDAVRLLDELARTTALVEAVAPDEHRIHPLLRSYLSLALLRQRPALHRQLQVVAARWWADRDDAAHALRHAARVDDPQPVTELLHRYGITLLLGGDSGALGRALGGIDADVRRGDPELALLGVFVHLEDREPAAAAAELDQVRRSWPVAAGPRLDALRASVELIIPGPVEAERRRWARVEPPDAETAALVHAARAVAQLTAGSPDPPLLEAELRRTLELARARGFGYLEVQALTMLAGLVGLQGDHAGLVGCAEEAVTVAIEHDRHPSAWSATAMSMLAWVDLLAGRPGMAAARTEEALGAGDRPAPETWYLLHAVHGAALADQGQRASGLAELQRARSDFGTTPTSVPLAAAFAVLEHRTAVLQGNTAAAVQVADWLAARAPGVGELALMRAWAEAAAGHHETARTAVAPLHTTPGSTVLPATPVDVLLVEAEAALQLGDAGGGGGAGAAAFAVAAPLDAVRPFALAGPCVRELLDRDTATGIDGRLLGRIATARRAVEADAAEPLTERELAMLTLLPSLLTTREIAAEFTVSVNTVKSHIRSIYSKLGVSSRRDAVRLAQERGLLR